MRLCSMFLVRGDELIYLLNTLDELETRVLCIFRKNRYFEPIIKIKFDYVMRSYMMKLRFGTILFYYNIIVAKISHKVLCTPDF